MALAALWVLPGWAVLRTLGVRGIVGLGAGPAATAGLVGALGVLYGSVGVPWTLASLLAGAAVAILAAVGVGALLGVGAGRRTPLRPGLAVPAPLGRRGRWALGLSLAVAAVLLAGPMLAGMGAPDRPEQAWDALFHLNGVAVVRETGNASSFGALAPLYGGGTSPYYPVVWHAVAAVAPGLGDVAAAANIQNLVISAVVWPLGLAALTRVAAPGLAAALVAPVLAASFVAFPAVVLTVLAPWPFGLSVAVLPGALGVLLVALRSRWLWRTKLAAVLALAVAAGGVVLSHGSGVFSLLVLAGPVVVVVLVRQARQWWVVGRPRVVAVSVIGVIALIVAVVTIALRLPSLQTTLNYERSGASTYWPALGRIILDAPMVFDYGPQGAGNLVVTALTLLGAGVCLRRRHGRWLVLAWLSTVLLVLLAAGPPQNPVRGLTGFWYTQAARIAPLAVIPAVVLGAIGLTALAGALARRLPARSRSPRAGAGLALPVVLLAVVAVATSGMRWDLKERITASVYEPGQIAWGTMLSGPELELMDRIGAELPPDALVLGDPFNGSAYLPALAGVDVVYPQLASVRGADAKFLEHSFNALHTDPRVCEAVRRLGVTHVYNDTALGTDGVKTNRRTNGLRFLDTSAGFERVDSGGTATVWRLTACG